MSLHTPLCFWYCAHVEMYSLAFPWIASAMNMYNEHGSHPSQSPQSNAILPPEKIDLHFKRPMAFSFWDLQLLEFNCAQLWMLSTANATPVARNFWPQLRLLLAHGLEVIL